MEHSRARTGIASFVFALLLLAFNWPILSIPAAGTLLSWLFAAWGLAIALLALAAFVAARGSGQACASPEIEAGGPDGAGRPDGTLDATLDDRPGCGDV